MAPKLAKGMDPLGELSSDEEASSGGEGGEAGPSAAAGAAPKAKEVDFEALQKAGYRGCAPLAPPAPEPRAGSEGQP